MSREFEIQFEEESKLQHTVLEDTYYYNDNEDKYYNAKLELFGHCLQITTHDYSGNTLNLIKTIMSKGTEIEVNILLENSDGIYFTIEDTRFCMSREKYGLVNAFYARLNKSFIDERIEFKEKVLREVEELKKESFVESIFENYIEDVSSYYFMNYKLIWGIELLIERESKIGKFLLKSESRYRKTLISTTEKKEDGRICTYENIENYELLKDYMENHFKLMSRLIGKKFNYDEQFATYITYELINIFVVKYFSNEWKREYNEFFYDISDISINDAIVRFCCIDNINPTDLLNVGKIIYFLMYNKKFDDNTEYLENYDVVVGEINSDMENKKLLEFEKNMIRGKKNKSYSIEIIDLMNGQEFENFVSMMFGKMGYDCEVTKASRDQGIDVVASKNQIKIGIQAKCYSNKVSNSAIQEVVTGMKYYNCDKGIVVTNNYFTSSAIEIAQVHNITLWDRDMLKIKINEIFSE